MTPFSACADLVCRLCPMQHCLCGFTSSVSAVFWKEILSPSHRNGGIVLNLISFGINPQTLIFFPQTEEGGIQPAFTPAGSCQTNACGEQPQCSWVLFVSQIIPNCPNFTVLRRSSIKHLLS